MSDVVATPTEKLAKVRHRFNLLAGAAIVLAVVVLVAAIGYGAWMTHRVDKLQQGSDRGVCIARELAGPWVGLKETFAAPAGDATARAKALQTMTDALDRLDHLDEIC